MILMLESRSAQGWKNMLVNLVLSFSCSELLTEKVGIKANNLWNP